jgi:hypothetical protein
LLLFPMSMRISGRVGENHSRMREWPRGDSCSLPPRLRLDGVVHAVGVIVGYLLALNVLRFAEKHIDREEELTRWSILQIEVGHFFFQNGYSLFILSSPIAVGLWVIFMVRAAFRGLNQH